MHIICNRFNKQRVIEMLAPYGCNMLITSRWQVSLQDKRGRIYDHYFVCKPTRKQISKLKKNMLTYVPYNHVCYMCGKRIRLSAATSIDNINYAHDKCIRDIL